MLTVRHTRRLFDSVRQFDPYLEECGGVVADYLPRDFVERNTSAIVVSEEDGFGRVFTSDDPEWREFRPPDGYELSFVEYPGDPVTLTAVAIFVGKVVLAAAVSTALSYGIQALIGTPKPSSKIDQGPQTVYGFEGVRTTAQVGIPVPIVFGRHVVGGNVVALSTRGTYVGDTPSIFDEVLYMQVSMCKGPIVDSESIRLNGNLAQFYGGEFEVARNSQNVIGALDQEPNTSTSLSNSSTNQAIGLDLLSNSTVDGQGETVGFTTDTEVDQIDLNIFHPQGLYTQASGGFAAASVEWRIRYRPVGTSTWSAWENVWEQATRPSPYTATSKHPTPARAVYEVEVERYTARPASTNVQNEIQLSSAVLRVNEFFSYPGKVILGLRLVANVNLHSQLPSIQHVIRGYKDVLRWDGVDLENPAYEEDAPYYDNPAWICLTMLQDPSLNLKARLGYTEIDLLSFKEWADWCNDQVDDGTGTGATERRCRFDGVFDGSGNETALAAFLRVCSTARATPVIVGSTIKIKFERARPRRQLFTMALIDEGSFQISYLTKRRKATQFVVRYLNENTGWDLDIAPVDDTEALAAGRPVVKEVDDVFGITRPSQAHREAKFRLNLGKFIADAVRFRTSINAIDCEPGDVVGVQHDVPQWGYGGRVVGAGSAEIRLDREVTIEAGVVYEVCAQTLRTQKVQTRLVDTNQCPPGVYPANSIIYLQDAWEEQPEVGAPYSFGRENISVKDIVVTDVKVQADGKVEVVGVTYTDDLHDDSIDEINLPDYSDLPNPTSIPPCVDPPPELVERIEPATGGGGWLSVIDVSWSLPSVPISFTRVYSRDLGAVAPPGFEIPFDFVEEVPAPSNSTTIRTGLVVGSTYEVRVIFVSPGGSHMPVTACDGSEVTIQNLGLLPEAPQSVQAIRNALDMRIRWDAVPDAQSYEVRRGGEQWQQSRLIGTVPASAREIITQDWNPTVGPGNPKERFYVRAINGGFYGPPGWVDLPDNLDAWRGSLFGLLQQWDGNALGWPGTLSNVFVNGDGYLQLVDKSQPGYYESPEIDLMSLVFWRLGTIFRCVVDDGPDLLSTVLPYDSSFGVLNDWNGPIAPASWYVTSRVLIRGSSSLGGVFSQQWLEEHTQDWFGIRYVQLRVELATTHADWEPIVRELYLTAEDF